jgi:hypothetical protein
MPRLTIRHLLLWAVCSGLLASRATVPASLAVSLAVTIYGGCIAVSVIVIYTCVRNSLWTRTQPGHWFAFVGAWEMVDQIVVTPACLSFLPLRAEYVYSFAFIGMAAIFAVGAIMGRWEWYWRLAIALHSLEAMSSAAWRLAQEWWGYPGASEFIREKATPAIGVATVLVTLASIGIDLYRKRHRDWLHWVGIVWFSFKWYGQIRAYVIPFFFPTRR